MPITKGGWFILTCPRCEKEQDESRFCLDYRTDPPRYRKHCLTCQAEANKKSRHKNQDAYNEKARLRRYERKRKAIEYKGGVCVDCDEVVHPAAFDFHHIDGTTKERDPGLMMSCSEETLFAELDKCILLCANCHRIRHFNDGY